MGRRRATFTQNDITRAFKGAEAAGVQVQVEIAADGKIVVVPMSQSNQPQEDNSAPTKPIVL